MRLNKKCISFILSLLLAFPTVLPVAGSAEAKGVTSPMQKRDASFEASLSEAEESSSGYLAMSRDDLPTVRDCSRAAGEYGISVKSLEHSYNTDLDTLKDIYPATRRQKYNECWAFTTVAMAEFSGIEAGEADSNTDYSELALAYFTNRLPTDPLGGTNGDEVIPQSDDAFLYGGGNMELGIRTLSRWNGILKESSVPQSKAKEVAKYGLADYYAYDENAAILRGGYYINVKDEADRDTVKTAVKTLGAVGLGFGAYKCFYDKDTNTYYNPYSYKKQDPDYDSRYISNHAVVIVGWDDAKEVAGIDQKGAWLVRNSWSEKSSMSYDSYFWLSYYDRSICTRGFALEMVSPSTYDNNYQYDGSVFCEPRVQNEGEKAYYDPIKKGANVFTASGDERLKAVSFSSEDTNASYSVDVYTGESVTADPESGKRVATVSGKTTYAGQNTVDLTEPVELKKGESFSVVISLPQASRGISLEYGYDFGSMDVRVDIPDDSSYLYQNGRWYNMSDVDDMGATWSDDTSGEGYGNLCIKAYTKDSGTPRTIDKPVSLAQNSATKNSITLRWKRQSGIDGYYIYRRSSAKGIWSAPIAQVSGNRANCKITSLSPGTSYWYGIQSYAKRSDGRIDKSPISATVAAVTAPGRVTGLKASSKSGTVTLKWKKQSGADGYYVYRKSKKGGKTKCVARIKDGNKTVYTSKKLKRGRTYYYYVRAFRKNSKKVYRGATSTTVKKTVK